MKSIRIFPQEFNFKFLPIIILSFVFSILHVFLYSSTAWADAHKAENSSCRTKNGKNIEKQTITIVTGDPEGMYYYCGKRIEKIINLTSKLHTITSLSSNGALDNISIVSSHSADFGFSQLDMLLRANSAAEEFKSRTRNDLVVVTVLFPEIFTIVGNDKINKINDFNDKLISTHQPGSGIYQNSTQFLKIAGLAGSVKRIELNMTDTEKHFCARHIDGFISIIGMPAAVINNTLTKTPGSKIIGIPPELKNKISDSIRGFVPYEIPALTYSNPEPIPTIATFAVLFTSRNQSRGAVETILKTIYSLPDFSTAAGTRYGKVRYLSQENAAKLLGGIKDLKIHPCAAEFFGISNKENKTSVNNIIKTNKTNKNQLIRKNKNNH